ncbi:MAG: hypothetical protein WC647_13685 [Desulfomonilaceae bacterium]|jgi:uncharacterized protein YwgA
MNVRDFVVLCYGAFDGNINGKTNLQKKVYFLAVSLGKAEELGYRAHYYGPYSADVAESNTELKSLNYLSECSTSWGSDNRGFEVARYDFSLTDEGWRLFERKRTENPDIWEDISTLAEKIKEAGNLDYWDLSIAAKAYFILDQKGKSVSSQEIQGAAKGLGWEVTREELDRASTFLEKINLIKSLAA